MPWTVLIHDEVRSWIGTLDEDSREHLGAAINRLAADGPALGRPLVDTIEGSRYRNMKELRPGSSGRSEIRVLFAFDPERCGILLLGGDKAGRWRRWYRKAIPIADRRFDEHCARLAERRIERRDS